MPEKHCQRCEKPFHVPPSRDTQKFCSIACYDKHGTANPKWRGGTVNSDGYVYIFVPDHPDATKDGYVLEHRLVMEKHLGRRLERREAVHHLNHVSDDNRIENLHLCASNGKHFIEHHLVERDAVGKFAVVKKRRH